MRNAVALLAGIALFAGCTREVVDRAGNPTKPLSEGEEKYESEQLPRIHDSFDRMKAAMLAGDTRAYFELLSSLQRETYGGYDGFLREYTPSQNGFREMWRDAQVAQVAIDKQNKVKATVLIHWGTPAPRAIEFLLEDGTWRLHYPVPE